MTTVEMFELVKDQYPSRLGVKTLKVSNLRYAEVIFALDDDNIQRCLERGIQLTKKDVIAIPCKALTGDMEILHLKLSDLPFEPEAKLLSGLQRSFTSYGQVLDVGIIVEPTTENYSGTGYVAINVKPQDEQMQFRD